MHEMLYDTLQTLLWHYRKEVVCPHGHTDNCPESLQLMSNMWHAKQFSWFSSPKKEEKWLLNVLSPKLEAKPKELHLWKLQEQHHPFCQLVGWVGPSVQCRTLNLCKLHAHANCTCRPMCKWTSYYLHHWSLASEKNQIWQILLMFRSCTEK